MDTSVTELRAHLSEWLGMAGKGEDIVITDRGVPIARLTGLDATATIERLMSAGVITRPAKAARSRATGRARPTATASIAQRVTDQRD